jgi:hypothetical protein
VVIFSAAVPLQWGIKHLNEQWPEYWAEIFRRKGFYAVDCLRKKIWNNSKVEYWYAQNTIIYARKEVIESNSRMLAEFQNTNPKVLSVVHPRKYLLLAKHANILFRLLPDSLLFKIKRYFKA